MPPYVVRVPVPPNTLPTAPLRVAIEPIEGVLVFAEAMFPDKSYDAVGVRLLDRDQQISPAGGAGWIHENGRTVILWREGERKALSGPPYLLNVELYNEADDFPHSPEIRIHLVQG